MQSTGMQLSHKQSKLWAGTPSLRGPGSHTCRAGDDPGDTPDKPPVGAILSPALVPPPRRGGTSDPSHLSMLHEALWSQPHCLWDPPQITLQLTWACPLLCLRHSSSLIWLLSAQTLTQPSITIVDGPSDCFQNDLATKSSKRLIS